MLWKMSINQQTMVNKGYIFSNFHFNHITLLESVIKTEEPNESTIDMFDDEFYAIMEQNFSVKTNANETSEAENVNEDLETDSDATEIDENDHSAVSGQ